MVGWQKSFITAPILRTSLTWSNDKMDETNMQHALHWDGDDVTGWIVTEKFDGCRAYWDGEQLWSRGGKAIDIPDEWRESLPAGVHLDGELFAGYGNSRRVASAIRHGSSKFTAGMMFMVFDAPEAAGDYLARMRTVRGNEVVKLVPISIANSTRRAIETMEEVQARGGEGLMLRHPRLRYAPGRTNLMLKMKGAE
jgi:DNA ligase-1